MVVAKGWYDSYVLCSSIAPSAFWENYNTPNLYFPASASSTVWLLWSHYNFAQIIWTEFGHFASMDSSIAISWYVMHVMHISFPTCVYISHHDQNIPMLRNPTLNIQASLLLEFTLQGFAFTLQVGAMKNPLLDGTDPVSWVIDGLGHLADGHNCDQRGLLLHHHHHKDHVITFTTFPYTLSHMHSEEAWKCFSFKSPNISWFSHVKRKDSHSRIPWNMLNFPQL